MNQEESKEATKNVHHNHNKTKESPAHNPWAVLYVPCHADLPEVTEFNYALTQDS